MSTHPLMTERSPASHVTHCIGGEHFNLSDGLMLNMDDEAKIDEGPIMVICVGVLARIHNSGGMSGPFMEGNIPCVHRRGITTSPPSFCITKCIVSQTSS